MDIEGPAKIYSPQAIKREKGSQLKKKKQQLKKKAPVKKDEKEHKIDIKI